MLLGGRNPEVTLFYRKYNRGSYQTLLEIISGKTLKINHIIYILYWEKRSDPNFKVNFYFLISNSQNSSIVLSLTCVTFFKFKLWVISKIDQSKCLYDVPTSNFPFVTQRFFAHCPLSTISFMNDKFSRV